VAGGSVKEEEEIKLLAKAAVEYIFKFCVLLGLLCIEKSS
jgi:hypothetical protein